MSIVVQKFGGTSVADAAKIKCAAQRAMDAVKKGDNGEDNVGFGFGCAEGIDNEGNPIPCDDEKLKDVVYEYYEEDGKMGIKMIDKNPNSMTATATFVTGEDGNPVVKIEE